MGLFKKRQRTEEELETMRNELRMLRERLERTDEAKASLGERVGRLDAENERLNTQVGSMESKVGTFESQVSDVAEKVGAVQHEVVTVAGSIGPAIDDAVKSVVEQSPSPDDVEGLRSEVTRLGELTSKVEALDAVFAGQATATVNVDEGGAPAVDLAALADLKNQLEDVAASLQLQQVQIADVALVATDAAERTELTESKVDDLAVPDNWEPIDATPPRDSDAELHQQLGQLAEKVGALDSRVNQVSLELTNQLTELSTDLDRASAQADTSDLIDLLTARLDDVTGGQQRLANEQARYAIQFRDDLAELADRLRKQN